MKSRARRFLQLASICPALLLGSWLIGYTQRQATRSPSRDFNHRLDQLILEARAEATRGTAGTFEIDLDLAPEVVEFDGFLSYGTPIPTTNGGDLHPHVIRVTSKRIEMPVFNTRKITNTATAWDGAPATAATDRKGIEPWLADFMDRLSRRFGGKSSTPP